MPLQDLIIAADQSVNIQVEIVTQDATGGAQMTFSTLTVNGLTAVPCMIRAPSASLVNSYAQNGIQITNHILFAFNVDNYITGGLSAQHRMVDVATGAIYQVQGSGIFNPLILSAEPVYRADVQVRRAPS